jgi:hypothetical protein
MRHRLRSDAGISRWTRAGAALLLIAVFAAPLAGVVRAETRGAKESGGAPGPDPVQQEKAVQREAKRAERERRAA